MAARDDLSVGHLSDLADEDRKYLLIAFKF
jgi:hypothetical protein